MGEEKEEGRRRWKREKERKGKEDEIGNEMEEMGDMEKPCGV